MSLLIAKKTDVWFSGSYWGFTKTLLRREPKEIAAEIIRVGLREFELPQNGNLTMICAITKGSHNTTIKSYLTHEQVRNLEPKVYDELVKKGVIPISHRQSAPSTWTPKSGGEGPTPTFVELFVQSSGKTITFEVTWILEMFSPYWANSAQLHTKHRDILRAVIYDGERRVPVEVEMRDVHERNPELFAILQPYRHPSVL